MKIVDAFIGELEREAETTKRVLARVPNEKMNWQPHPKSMSLGQLASHITRIPGGVAKMLAQPQFEGGPVNTPPPGARKRIRTGPQPGSQRGRREGNTE